MASTMLFFSGCTLEPWACNLKSVRIKMGETRRVKLFWITVLLIGACTAAPAIPPVATETPAITAPIPLAPAQEAEFIDSSLELRWEWPDLKEGQYFAVRLWVDELLPQEVWVQEPYVQAQNLIDSFSRELGDFHWMVSVVNTDSDGAFASMQSEWSAAQTLHRVRRLRIDPLPQQEQSPAARFFAEQDFASQADLFNALRDWIYRNTDVGSDLAVYAPDYSDALQMMLDYANGLGPAPELYCNGMSTGMLTLLGELGYEGRLIFLYGEAEGWINQHTMIEVFNTETQTWELHDPSNNLYFVDSDYALVDTGRMVFGTLDALMACDAAGICTPDLSVVDQYLSAYRYGYVNRFWVNLDRIRISRRIEAFDNANFAEWIAQIVGVPVSELSFRFDQR